MAFAFWIAFRYRFGSRVTPGVPLKRRAYYRMSVFVDRYGLHVATPSILKHLIIDDILVHIHVILLIDVMDVMP